MIAHIKGLKNITDAKRSDFINSTKYHIEKFHKLSLNYKFPPDLKKLTRKENNYSQKFDAILGKIKTETKIKNITLNYNELIDIGIEWFAVLNRMNEFKNTKSSKIDLVDKLNTILLSEIELSIKYEELAPNSKESELLNNSVSRNTEKLNNILNE